MATEAQRLASIRANTLAQLDYASARGAELDSVPVDERPRMTYTVGGRTVGWNEYRASLSAKEDAALARLERLPKISPPFTIDQVVR